jgi:hypothetical protein
MMQRWAFGLIAIAIIGWFGMIPLYYHLMGPVWEPLNVPVAVGFHRSVTTSPFVISANEPYEIYLYVRQSVPYADCLLGQTDDYSDRCKPYHSLIDVAWTVRDLHGRVIDSGRSGGTCCDDGGGQVGTELGAFSADQRTIGTLTLVYAKDTSALAPLGPRAEIQVDSQVTEGASLSEALAYIMCILFSATGLVMLLISRLRISRGRKRNALRVDGSTDT